MYLPVSSQAPNVPLATFSLTLSVDLPRNANSQSWMEPAPLVARWVSQPRSIIRVKIRAAPLRNRWAPYIRITAAFRRRAAAMRVAHSVIRSNNGSAQAGGGDAGSTRISSTQQRLLRG